MKLEFDSDFVDDLKKIRRSDPKLLKRVWEKLSFFEKNPKHLSLRLHKLSGSMTDVWSVSVNRKIRMIFYYKSDDVAYFVDIGSHDEVYRK